ncbi:zinc finger protein 729-like [Centruroides sculpturatus]|uniref:zinc finger protein 729-like n=1 Tax=Centruroides sculpturatus TaxID=218467 RepID=UPI000C6CA4F1|nr:zinc finger protein 729-like [Centruroides sculpturatus]XP_023223338.1 zinc finger protein 729-like [Centruroides sculpturatus]XP_023223339.1 zinc finger protein 729-like [Centruroides sculpturatus]
MFAMPGSFSCELCGYIAGSHRMLARHRATTHETKVFRCSECPFVTRYRTNLYRHRREIHGLNKVNACAFCGFFATTTDDLRIHRQTCPAGGLQDIQSQPLFPSEIPQYEIFPNDYVQFGTVPTFKEPFPVLPQPAVSCNEYNPFNQAPIFNEPYNFIPPTQPISNKVPYNEIEGTPDMFVLPPTISQIPITKEKIVTETPKSPDTTNINDLSKRLEPNKMNEMAKKLEPAKVRRSYICEPCDLKTTNPREYLAHRRDVHKEKITIYECKYCIYASKNPQKLQRHYGLVHRQISSIKRAYNSIKGKTQVAKKSCVSQKKNKIIVKPEIRKEKQRSDEVALEPTIPSEDTSQKLPSPSSSGNAYNEVEKDCLQKPIQQKFKCSACHFHTKSKLVLLHHEKTKHLKKKFYRCLQCVYVTHVKSRYTKHVRYHSLSKIKCPHCDFKTAYKWNLDRHMKNHISEGSYRCPKCCFSAHSKQSLTIHIVNHHSESINSVNDLMIIGDNSDDEKNMTETNSYNDLTCTSERIVENENIEAERSTESRSIHISRNNGNKTMNSDLVNDPYLKTPLIENAPIVAKPKMQKAVKSGGGSSRRMMEHSEKKYSCPLCEVTFDHLAWLARHLNRRHNNEQAKDITAIVQMLAAKSKPGAVSKLKNKKNGKKPHRATPVCAVCGYKTKWFSEMKRHMRVHTDEKPFECPFCEYKCRWKGDLTRHVQKRHDDITIQNSEIHSKSFIKSPEDDNAILPLKHKRACVIRNEKMRKYLKKSDDQDCPLDLSVDRNMALSSRYQNDFPFFEGSHFYKNDKNLQMANDQYFESSKLSRSSSANSKNSFMIQSSSKSFSCVFCDFTTTNEFSFKVHNTRHFTKYPFMCSTCSFRSNWQMKIVKHIKLKQHVSRDHDNARVLLIDSKGDISECFSDNGEDLDDGSFTKQDDDKLSEEHILFDEFDRNKQNISDRTFKIPFMMKESSKSYFCRYCKYKDKERRNVLAHMCEHTGQKPYRCRICGFCSLWLNVLKRHVRRRHKGRLSDIEEGFKIIEKNRVISVVGSTVLRISKSENSKITTLCSCKICPYKCMGQNVLENHMKHHNSVGTASYKCRFCPYYCKFKDTLVKHLNVHGMSVSNATKIISQCKLSQLEGSTHEKYRCSYCPYRTDSTTTYLYHKQCHRPNRSAPFKCKHCSFWATHKAVLDDHISLHSRHSRDRKSSSRSQFPSMPIPIEVKQNGKIIKVYRCRFCPMMGDNLDTVYKHELLHSRSSKMYKCNICKKICESEKHLTAHLKSHTSPIQNDLLRYGSDSDGNYFKSSLNNSIIQHSEDNNKFNYFCTKCPAAFVNKSDYAIHREIHQNTGNSMHITDYRGFDNEKYSQNYGSEHSRHKNQGFGMIERDNLVEHHNYDAGKGAEKDKTEIVEQTVENTGFEQMLLLEEAETKSFVNGNNTSILPQKLHNCFQCPAAFCKPAILAFHTSLHGTQGKYVCPECNYATDSKNNVIAHYQLHVKPKSASKSSLRLYECTKCPAKFQKPKGLRKHFSLHGQKNKFTCEICDYSVPCAVNLFRHKVVHVNVNSNNNNTSNNNNNSSNNINNNNSNNNNQIEHNYVQEQPVENTEQITESPDQISNQKESVEQKKSPKSERVEDKRYFSCTFCPYVHPRKFAVQNHMRRHASTEGLQCPHCNYRSLQASVLRDHLKWHFQAQFVFSPQAFMKFDDMEVWLVNGKENENELIFKDHGQNSKNKEGRFFSAISENYIENEERKPLPFVDTKSIEKMVEEELNLIVEDNKDDDERKDDDYDDQRKDDDNDDQRKDDDDEQRKNEDDDDDDDDEKKEDSEYMEEIEKLKQLAMKQEVKIVLMDVLSQDKNKSETLEVQDNTETTIGSNQCSQKSNEESKETKEKPKENTIQHCEESNSSDSTVVIETPLENTETNVDNNNVSTSETAVTKEKVVTFEEVPEVTTTIEQQAPEVEETNTLVIKENEIVETNYVERTAPTICEYTNTIVGEEENLHTHLYGNDVMMVRFDDDYLPSESGITEVIEVEQAPVQDVDLSLDAAIVDKEGIMEGDMNAMFSDDVQVVEVVAENEDSLNDFSAELKNEPDRNSNDLMVSCHPNNFTTDCEPTSIAEVEIKV